MGLTCTFLKREHVNALFKIFWPLLSKFLLQTSLFWLKIAKMTTFFKIGKSAILKS